MIKRILKIIGIFIGLVVAAFACLIGYLTVTEYDPAPEETAAIYMTDTLPDAKAGQSLSLLSWNIGYGALGDNADFFMDGGSSVITADEARVRDNMDAIEDHLIREDPDIVLLQEVDQDSRRSHHIPEANELHGLLGASACSTFANNYLALVPYPVPPLGRIDSGIMTLSRLQIDEVSGSACPVPSPGPSAPLT